MSVIAGLFGLMSRGFFSLACFLLLGCADAFVAVRYLRRRSPRYVGEKRAAVLTGTLIAVSVLVAFFLIRCLYGPFFWAYPGGTPVPY